MISGEKSPTNETDACDTKSQIYSCLLELSAIASVIESNRESLIPIDSLIITNVYLLVKFSTQCMMVIVLALNYGSLVLTKPSWS